MSSPSKVLIAAALLAVATSAGLSLSAPVAQADPLAYDPYQPGYHPGSQAYERRFHVMEPNWFDRRDTITLQAGDAVAANQAIQMRDPWPPYVNDRTILFHGEVMDGAIDRYKTGGVIEPEPVTAEE